jgi:PAS domain S-box-containing protein
METTATERLAILEAFAESASDALLGDDLEGRVTTWNRSAERIFGYPEGEMLGQPTRQLFPEHLQQELGEVYAGVLAGDPIDHFETEARRRGGMPIAVSLSIRALVDGSGRTVGTVSIAQDLTERRLAQASLAEVEARLSGGEAQIHVGRWLWDVGTGAVQWSDELHRIHGIDPLDFAGTIEGHLGCAHPADRDRLRDVMVAAVASGRPFEQEYRILRPDGGERRLYLRGDPALSSAGAVIGLRGIAQDVTDGRITPDRPAP